MKLNKVTKQKIFDKYNNECAYCNSKEHLTIDHIKPKSKGGTNDVYNLQTLCKDCNQEKDNTYTETESRFIDFIIEVSTNKIEDFLK